MRPAWLDARGGERCDVESIPETRYARALSGAQVAYQIVGSGPIPVLGFTAMPGIEMMWEEPSFVRFLDRLSLFSRHVWFDGRGLASSSSLPSGSRVVESVVDEMVTVLDALGEERAVFLGLTSLSSLLLAATHPSRTTALVLLDPTARFRSDDGYAGLDDDQVEQGLAMLERDWGTGAVSRVLGWGGDERLRRWYGKCERLTYPPDEAVRVFRTVLDVDVRDVLATISVPTLVVARQRHPRLSQSQYVAEHIAGVKYVELTASDYLLAAFDAMDAMEEFVTGRLPEAASDRVLATIFHRHRRFDSPGGRGGRSGLAVSSREHDALVRRQLGRFRGREIKTMGDGFLATFDGPARAIRCGCAIRAEATQHASFSATARVRAPATDGGRAKLCWPRRTARG
jgi:pimeloyl-ACP methyl ester carboxylesterase